MWSIYYRERPPLFDDPSAIVKAYNSSVIHLLSCHSLIIIRLSSAFMVANVSSEWETKSLERIISRRVQLLCLQQRATSCVMPFYSCFTATREMCVWRDLRSSENPPELRGDTESIKKVVAPEFRTLLPCFLNSAAPASAQAICPAPWWSEGHCIPSVSWIIDYSSGSKDQIIQTTKIYTNKTRKHLGIGRKHSVGIITQDIKIYQEMICGFWHLLMCCVR